MKKPINDNSKSKEFHENKQSPHTVKEQKKNSFIVDSGNHASKNSNVHSNFSNHRQKENEKHTQPLTIESLETNKAPNSINYQSKLSKYKKAATLTIDKSLKESTNSKGKIVSKQESEMIGNRLFKNSISLAETKNSFKISLTKQRESKFKENCSFDPKLGDQSILLSLKRYYSLEKSLPLSLQQTPLKSSKLTKKAEINLETEGSSMKKEYNQKEKINSAKKQTDRILLFEKLYSETNKLKSNNNKLTEEFYSQFKFSPQINDTSVPKFENYLNRAERWLKKKKNTEDSIKELSMKDSKTMQNFFSPRISLRSSQIEKHEKIWEDLYNEHKELITKREIETKKQEKEQNKMFKPKVTLSENTETISKEMTNSIIKKLFIHFKAQDEESIVIEDEALFNNKLKVFSKGQIQVLEKLISFLKEKKTVMFNDFCEFCNKEIGNLIYRDKKQLRDWYLNTRCETSPKCMKNRENEKKKAFISKTSQEIMKNPKKNSIKFEERNINLIKKKSLMEENVWKKRFDEVQGIPEEELKKIMRKMSSA